MFLKSFTDRNLLISAGIAGFTRSRPPSSAEHFSFLTGPLIFDSPKQLRNQTIKAFKILRPPLLPVNCRTLLKFPGEESNLRILYPFPGVFCLSFVSKWVVPGSWAATRTFRPADSTHADTHRAEPVRTASRLDFNGKSFLPRKWRAEEALRGKKSRKADGGKFLFFFSFLLINRETRKLQFGMRGRQKLCN